MRRNLTASAPNQVWVGDITYLPIADGKLLYPATVIDVYSRRLRGWSMADHMRAEPVTDALKAAVRTRGGRVDDVIFHSDHGAQYGSKAFADACHRAGIRRSTGAVGTSADNAAAESFFASLKREILPDRRSRPTEPAARLAVFSQRDSACEGPPVRCRAPLCGARRPSHERRRSSVSIRRLR
ncbi:transposase [Streptomyces sp. NBC_01450]|uniref:transposase n=1 Tax=Streptomyces sp. NBC_01450 TaxID=2903871 RepID=UPI003FCE65CD